MNKELELESNYVYTSRIELDPQSKMYSIEQLALCEKQSFIAGATSKYVEKQKLEFAIEQIKEIHSKMTFFEISNMENTLDNLYYKIKELEQKLSKI